MKVTHLANLCRRYEAPMTAWAARAVVSWVDKTALRSLRMSSPDQNGHLDSIYHRREKADIRH